MLSDFREVSCTPITTTHHEPDHAGSWWVVQLYCSLPRWLYGNSSYFSRSGSLSAYAHPCYDDGHPGPPLKIALGLLYLTLRLWCRVS